MKLEPGKTKIGTALLKDEETQIITEFTVFYGNVLSPVINREVVHLPKEEYNKMLEAFLNEEQLPEEQFTIEPGGGEYDIPTRREVLLATIEMLNIEKQIKMAMDNPQPDETLADDEEEEEEEEENEIPSKKKGRRRDVIGRSSPLGTIVLILVAALLFGLTVFMIKDIVIKSHAVIELELKQSEITIRAGDAFNPPDYVKSVSQDEGVYIIYPSLDTKDVGVHNLDYVATNGIKNIRKTLTVTVIDGSSPVIELTHEEIHLVRNRDEETFDPMNYIKEIKDDKDTDLEVEVNDLDWSKDEQSLSYRVKDSAGNTGKAVLLVKIEDKAICDKNAIYNSASNSCTCKSGYSGNGTACKLVSSQPTDSSDSSSDSGSGNSGSSSSGGTSWSESWTVDYTDYQPSNGQTDVTYTNNDTGESYTVSDSDTGPYESDEDLWAEIDNLGN